MAHWLQDISVIFSADTSDLRQLAIMVGEDPVSFYSGVDLSKSDLRGQDLRGMRFDRSRLQGALLDAATQIDSPYDPRQSQPDKPAVHKRYLAFPPELIPLIRCYSFRENYSMWGWAIKNLLDKVFLNAKKQVDLSQEETSWLALIGRSTSIISPIKSRNRRSHRITILVPDDVYNYCVRLGRIMGVGKSGGLTIGVVIGILLWAKIDPCVQDEVDLQSFVSSIMSKSRVS